MMLDQREFNAALKQDVVLLAENACGDNDAQASLHRAPGLKLTPSDRLKIEQELGVVGYKVGLF